MLYRQHGTNIAFESHKVFQDRNRLFTAIYTRCGNYSFYNVRFLVRGRIISVFTGHSRSYKNTLHAEYYPDSREHSAPYFTTNKQNPLLLA